MLTPNVPVRNSPVLGPDKLPADPGKNILLHVKRRRRKTAHGGVPGGIYPKSRSSRSAHLAPRASGSLCRHAALMIILSIRHLGLGGHRVMRTHSQGRPLCPFLLGGRRSPGCPGRFISPPAPRGEKKIKHLNRKKNTF